MSTNYPTSTDSYTTKVDNTDSVYAAHINAVQDAIAAIQAKLGVTSSAVSSSVDYFLYNASGLFKTHVHDGSTTALIPGSSLTSLGSIVSGAGQIPLINIAGINALTEKTTLVAGDYFLIEDSAASYAKKKAKMASFTAGVVDLSSNQTIGGTKTFSSNINLNGNQIISLVIENRTSDPGSPANGQIWFRSDI